MFRMWGKLVKDNHLQKDMVVCDESERTRTKKILAGLDEICSEFDLSTPIWLDSNINEMKRVSKARFTKDSFVESVEFDYLEIQIIEED